MSLILLASALVILAFGLAAYSGAPYLPTRRREIETALNLLNLRAGDTLIDLGAGDGAVLRAAAKRGIKAIGYEINPWLWLVAKLRCRHYPHLVKIRLRNYWHLKLPPADAIFVFLIEYRMEKLDRKLQREITKPTKVLSYIFPIPNRTAVKSHDGHYLYRYT